MATRSDSRFRIEPQLPQKGVKALLQRIMRNDGKGLVIIHQDRLLRFGAKLVFAMCEEFQTEAVIVNKSEVPDY